MKWAEQDWIILRNQGLILVCRVLKNQNSPIRVLRFLKLGFWQVAGGGCGRMALAGGKQLSSDLGGGQLAVHGLAFDKVFYFA